MSKFNKVKPIFLVLLILAASFILTKYSLLKLGALRIETDSTITVKGSYTMQILNQVATYNIGINTTNANRETAVAEVRTKSDTLVNALKEYGFEQKDIQTTAMSVYQREEPYYENGVQKYRKTDWYANTNVSVTLRDIEKVQDFSDKVYAMDISDLNGPYFALDYNTDTDTEIMMKAMENLDGKARTLAESKSRKLGEILSITEDDAQGNSIMLNSKMGEGRGGGGGGFQPGASTVTKTVTVTYRIY